MADNFPTLSDLAIINDRNAVDAGCTNIFEDIPFLNSLAADVSDGDSHKYLRYITAPDVGFRDVFTGVDRSKTEDEIVTVPLKILDASVTTDKAYADQYRNGPDAWMARETNRHLSTALKNSEIQTIQGTIGGAANGFPGFADAQTDLATNNMWYDAGGITDLTSVWICRTTDEGRDVQAVWGNMGRIDIDPYFVQEVQDATGKRYHAYTAPILSWIGLQLGSSFSVGRIANIDAGANGLTDDLLSHGLELFPEELRPNRIVMNKRSLFQLQRSRTATTTTGAEAPIPTDFMGIPIISTSSVPVGEAQIT